MYMAHPNHGDHMSDHDPTRDVIRCDFRANLQRAFPGYASITWDVPRDVGVNLARFPSKPGDVFDTIDAICGVFADTLDRSVDCYLAQQEPASRTFTGSRGLANLYELFDADTGETLGNATIYVDGEACEDVFAFDAHVDPRVIR